MDAFSYICGGVAGVGVLLLVLGTLLLFIRGLRERSWKWALAGFFLYYLIYLLIDAIVYKMKGTGG